MRPYAWAEKARAPIRHGSGGGRKPQGLQGAFVTGAGARAETAAAVRAQLDTWGKIIERIGLQPE
jgi:hypothetical protein